MTRPRFDIQHFVGCLAGSVIPPVQPYNRYTLTGVGPVYWVPAGTAFPAVLPRYDLFARFFVRRPGRGEFEVQVQHRQPDGRWAQTEVYGPVVIMFRAGEWGRDYTFRLLNIQAPDYGWYRFRLRLLRPRPRDRDRPVLADEYLEVMDTP